MHHPAAAGQADASRGLRDAAAAGGGARRGTAPSSSSTATTTATCWPGAPVGRRAGRRSSARRLLAQARRHKAEPLARYNLYRIEGPPWSIELVGRGLREAEGPIVEIERRRLSPASGACMTKVMAALRNSSPSFTAMAFGRAAARVESRIQTRTDRCRSTRRPRPLQAPVGDRAVGRPHRRRRTMGMRQVLGLYLPPMTLELGIGREPFSNAMAIANLIWGIGAVFAGDDRRPHGAGRVVVGGIVASIAGLYIMYAARSGFDGCGRRDCSASASAARASPRWLARWSRGTARKAHECDCLARHGGGHAAGSSPFPIRTCSMDCWRVADQPACCWPRPRPCRCRWRGRWPGRHQRQDARHAVGRRGDQGGLHDPSYLLLVIGFFVRGFHVAFYGVHLPAFVADKGLDGSVAVSALMTVGVANLIGTYLAGQSARFIGEARGLSFIYFGRCSSSWGCCSCPSRRPVIIGMSAVLGLLLAVDRAADLEPGGDLLRHALDVDAVRRRVPVPPGRGRSRACGLPAPLRRDQVVMI